MKKINEVWFMESRRNAIFDITEQKGEVSIKELEELFPEYSQMTIRRDLDFLENEGKIVKIKGGAKSITHLSRERFKTAEDEYGHREFLNAAQKQIIAEKALSVIEPDRSFFLDAGSSVMCLARKMPHERYFIITNGINVAMEASLNKNAVVNLIGGQISRNNLCVSGAGATEHLKNLNIDIAVLGVSCFSDDSGFTNADFDQCEIKRLAAKKAKKTVVLMDSTKIGRSMPYTFCHLEDIDVLISELNPQILKKKIKNIPKRVLVL